MKITVIPDDPDEAILVRFATLAPPSSHAIASGSRRDIVRDFELEARVEFALFEVRRVVEARLRAATRRIRRELRSDVTSDVTTVVHTYVSRAA